MFSKTLMKQTIKTNSGLFLIITLLQAGLLALISALGQDVAATGMMFYAMLPAIFSGIYVIITGNKLVAAQVDKGTMAYVLSTSVTRKKVVLTQAFFFTVSLFLMFTVSAGVHAIFAKIVLDSFTSTDLFMIIKLNLAAYALSLAFSGICFLASCVFNLSKNVVAISGGIVGGFLLLDFLPMFSEDLKIFGKLTIVALDDVNSIIAENSDYIWKLVILVAISIVTYILGITVFSKKDLPL